MLNEEIEEFIQKELNTSLADLSLKLSKKAHWPKQFIINQINGRQKVYKKFPFLSPYSNYIFPSPRAFAQASSERTARYKASLVSGERMVDLSGGMGIDSYFFAQNFDHLDYVEQDKKLFDISIENFQLMNVKNIHFHNEGAEDFLKNCDQYDLIYLDPDRREENKRLFQIEDCSPNLIELLPELLLKSKTVMVKLSPLLDIKLAIKKLGKVKSVHVVAVDNDCKELLFILNSSINSAPKVHCINITKKENVEYIFNYNQEEHEEVNYSFVQKYLYEPNVAITKAGAFKTLTSDFKINKLAPNTHLYTSNELISNFPGRILEVKEVVRPQKVKNRSANVVSKNFPLKAAQIRKKYKIKEGLNEFMYACSLWDKSNVFIWAERIG